MKSPDQLLLKKLSKTRIREMDWKGLLEIIRVRNPNMYHSYMEWIPITSLREMVIGQILIPEKLVVRSDRRGRK